MSVMTFSRISGVVLFGLAACLPGSRIGAFEATDGAAVEKTPLQTFATPRAALQAGLEGFRSGNAASAIEALKYAAAGGELLAQWKLAKIYANGDGVPRDDIKAYDYFSQIVTNYDEDDPNRRDRAVVSSALVSLGNYTLNGIANSKVRADPQRALQMFQFAATTFGDANAQYNLARMHLDGAGVDKDGREAIRWLFLAADKGHLQAHCAALGGDRAVVDNAPLAVSIRMRQQHSLELCGQVEALHLGDWGVGENVARILCRDRCDLNGKPIESMRLVKYLHELRKV